MTPTPTLFDAAPYVDRDYAAALEFVGELVGHPVDRLEPGVIGDACYCSIAATLATATCDPDDMLDWPEDGKLTPEWVENFGDGHRTFKVGQEGIEWPATPEHSIDLVGVEDPMREAAQYTESDPEVDANGNAWSWDFDDSGGDFLRHVVALPDDCYGGGGMVQEFIRRFDRGEFPSLVLFDMNESS